MNLYKRLATFVFSLVLFGCASVQSAWWNQQESPGQPGQSWKQRYTTHSFSDRHENARRDAANQLKRWADWKCPEGYDIEYVRTIEEAPAPRSAGLLAMYYGVADSVRKSITMEMGIQCQYAPTEVAG